MAPDELRAEILRLTAQYYAEAFAQPPFEPGQHAVPVAGRVFDDSELTHLVELGARLLADDRALRRPV